MTDTQRVPRSTSDAAAGAHADSPAPPREESIVDVLARFARGASDGALAAIVLIGALPVAAFPFLPPVAREFAAPVLALACLGAWGMTDRSLREHRSQRAERARTAPANTYTFVEEPAADRALRVARWALAAIGGAAAIASGFLAMAAMLGTWRS
ncbi:MAG TPA: hypothetical protein VFK13_06295 [Gemmatimonadaceae bacterium]|nr:hypothetical protein [Gemmatimonadaceae bacterium]